MEKIFSQGEARRSSWDIKTLQLNQDEIFLSLAELFLQT